jgi:ribonuclease HI
MDYTIVYIDATPGSIAYIVNDDYYYSHVLEPKLTVNEAEYQTLIEALEYCLLEGYDHLKIYSDSEVVVKQVLGEYQVRNNLIPFHQRATELLSQCTIGTTISWIPGHRNPADFYSRKGIKDNIHEE